MAEKKSMVSQIPTLANNITSADKILFFINSNVFMNFKIDEEDFNEVLSMLNTLSEYERYQIVFFGTDTFNEMCKQMPVKDAIYASKHGMEINIGDVKILNPRYLAYKRAMEEISRKIMTYDNLDVKIEGDSIRMDYSKRKTADEILDAKQVFIEETKRYPELRFSIIQGNKYLTARLPEHTEPLAIDMIISEIGATNPFILFVGSAKTDRSVIELIDKIGPHLCAVNDECDMVNVFKILSMEEFKTLIQILLELESF